MSLLTRLRPALRRPTRRPTRRSVRWAARLLVLVAVAVVAFQFVRIFALGNRHTVIPGQVYRSAQPTGDDLRDQVRDRGIRTVINLRGTSYTYPWYADEAQACHDLNVSQEDVTLSAGRLPPPSELRRLIEVLDRTDYPILIHCKQGADRTGLTAAVVLLLQTDATVARARRQLWPLYGHVEFGRTAAMDAFFDLYEDWLGAEGVPHAPDRFRHWATTAYTPGPAKSELTWLDPVPNPVAAVDAPFAVRLRAVNRSNVAWEFKPGDHAGVHLAYVVANDTMAPVYRGRAGLLRATVPPGGHIDLTVAVPKLAPGRYALVAELTDATAAGVPIRQTSFVQCGDESAMAEVVVR